MRRLLAFLPLAFVLAACGGSRGGADPTRGPATGNIPMQTETGQTTTTAPGY